MGAVSSRGAAAGKVSVAAVAREESDDDDGDLGLLELYDALQLHPFIPLPGDGPVDCEALGRFIGMLEGDKHGHFLRTLNGLKVIIQLTYTLLRPPVQVFVLVCLLSLAAAGLAKCPSC